MQTYRVAFEYKGKFDIPDDPRTRENELPGMVIAKLESEEFKVVEIEATHDHDIDHPFEFHGLSNESHSVLEIRLPLYDSDVNDREKVRRACLDAMKSGMCLEYVSEHEGPDFIQSTIGFRVENYEPDEI